jgi:hypothetical protein
MDGIDLLRAQALAKRNAAILAAKREYHATLKDIAALKNRMGIRPRGRPRKVVLREDSTLKATTVAKAILREGKPMTSASLPAHSATNPPMLKGAYGISSALNNSVVGSFVAKRQSVLTWLILFASQTNSLSSSMARNTWIRKPSSTTSDARTGSPRAVSTSSASETKNWTRISARSRMLSYGRLMN